MINGLTFLTYSDDFEYNQRNMKIITIYLNSNTMELHNSFLLGKETVKFNGEIMSSKYSLFGHTHRFSVDENGKEVSYSVRFRSGLPAAVDILRDGEPFLESPKNQFWRIGLITLGVIFIWELAQGRIIPF